MRGIQFQFCFGGFARSLLMMIDRISIHFHNFFSAEFVSHRSIQGNIDKNGLNFDSLGSVSKTSTKIFF